MEKPSNIEKTYSFTYSKLELLLRLFGTSCMVEGQRQGRNEHPITFHTDVYIIPKVNEELNRL